MESRTEFNLENNIQTWKSALTKKNNLTKSNIIELESHLLDLMDDLQSKELSKEESFLIARNRIGRIDDICLEFDKVNNNFSLISKAITYMKGALIYIVFIVLSKLFFMLTLLLSQYLRIENRTFSIVSVMLMVFCSISFFSIIYFNLKKRKSLFRKLSNVYVLTTLIVLSSLISYRLLALVVLPGIDVTNVGAFIVEFNTMQSNFTIYKTLCGFILLITFLILFLKNRKYDKLRYAK